ncbi:hypothetical protein MN116_006667 [Schistosoma mekongi]|uniref:Uncharacterized protein n=1 Tax=Schistosoma mekongi TaxID=38744 RepID=A0AAE1Z8I1_SCHME|nr:hypothetical protein MN116_006667 [Schistosoma mekongi]
MTVILMKFILQLSKVTYYINKFIDQLCLLTGPYSSECTYVAQNYAGILIDLVENTTSPKICQVVQAVTFYYFGEFLVRVQYGNEQTRYLKCGCSVYVLDSHCFHSLSTLSPCEYND